MNSILQMAIPGGHSAEDNSPAKGMRAAQDFEAVLLESLLQPLERTFSTVPGTEGQPGSEDYQYLGTQALAMGLASSGGLGIARMLIHNLLKPSSFHPINASSTAKVLGAPADKTK